MHDSIVVHDAEIGIKGKNRNRFEKRFMDNVERALGKGAKRVYKRHGRVVCDLGRTGDTDGIKETLAGLPGVAYFSFALKSRLDPAGMKKASLEVLDPEDRGTFKVVARRSNKEFGMTSQELKT